MRNILTVTALAALACIHSYGGVFAADLPARGPLVKSSPLVTAAASPFYIFGHGGVGLTDVQNDIAFPGTVTGSPHLWPAGAMIGAGFGVLSPIGPLVFGAEIEGNYDFTKGSAGSGATGFGCSPGSCTAADVHTQISSKNSWFFAEKALFGFTISQIMGYVPGSAQPSSWPVPITVPASFANNMMLLGVVGLAQRNVDLCATDVSNMETSTRMGVTTETSTATSCGSQWKNGFLVGGQARWMIAPNTHIRAEYDFVNFKSTFTPAASSAVFTALQGTNVASAKDEHRFMIGAGYNF